MFTGIITDLGRVRRVERRGDTRLSFETAYDTGGLDLGASIACSGVCLTVVDKGPGWFAADVSVETLSRTTLGDWRPGTAVNLERALRVGDELGGHLVAGHVDGVARAVERRAEGDSLRFVFTAPGGLLRFVAPKGSVALDGVSLTVNRVGENPDGENPDGENPDGENPDGENPDGENPDGENPDGENPDGDDPDGSGRFEVNVIPHTAEATTLGACQPGTRVNLEIDLLARYVQRLLVKE